MTSRFASLLLVLLAALLLAGCGDDGSGSDRATGGGGGSAQGDDDPTDAGDDGGDDTGGGDAGGQTLELSASGSELEFDKTELEAQAGSVTLHFTNKSTIPHNVALKTEDGETLGEGELVSKGGESEVTADLEPGTYTYYCSPHESAGMVGTLTVS